MNGQELVSALRNLGCPDLSDATGDDFDWICEDSDPSVRSFVEWVGKLDKDGMATVLTPQELEEWENLKTTAPNEILSGKLLDDALKVCETSDALTTDETEEELQLSVSALREELDLNLARLSELQASGNLLSSRQAQQAIRLDHLATVEENEDRDMRARQEHVLVMTEKFNVALDSLDEEINNTMKIIRQFGVNEKEPRFLSEISVSDLQKEDELYSKALQSFVDKQFGDASDLSSPDDLLSPPSICSDLVRGRDQEEFEELVNEISRLNKGLKDTERDRIILGAKEAGERAANEVAENQINKYSKTSSTPFDGSLLRTSAAELEPSVSTLQHDLATLTNTKLPQLLDKIGSSECGKILTIDCQTKMFRQKYTLDRLRLLENMLLDQTCRHEVLALLVEKELAGLQTIRHSLGMILEQKENDVEKLNREKECVKKLKGVDVKREVPKEDVVTRTLFKVVDNSGTNSRLVTYQDVADKVRGLTENLKKLEERKSAKEREFNERQFQLEKGVRILHKQLNIAGGRSSELTSPEIASKLNQLESGVRDLEHALKDRMTQWERERRAIKQDPHLATQKKLWIDFINNPKLLEANVTNMMSKTK